MKYTVLQSVYKGDNPFFLDESLKSLASQTLLPERIVLVKDGTLSESLEKVIADWKSHLPLFVVGYEKNLGLAHALNYGLQFVETELVARMDSDDISFPDRFEKEVLRFEIEPELAILGTGIEEFYFFDEKLITKKLNKPKEFVRSRLYPKILNKTSKKLYKGNPLAHSTVMIKTEILKKFKYNEKAKYEDIELWLRLLDSGITIKTIQEPLLRFRITDKTFSRRSYSRALDEYKTYIRTLHSFNGYSVLDIFIFLRFLSRLLPKTLNRRLYFSNRRKKFFLEDSMEIKFFEGSVFVLGGHLFQALLEKEEEGTVILQAVQLDTDIENIIEVDPKKIKLCHLKDSLNVKLSKIESKKKESPIPPPLPIVEHKTLEKEDFSFGGSLCA